MDNTTNKMGRLDKAFAHFLNNQREVLIVLIVTVALWLSTEYESIGDPKKDEVFSSQLVFMELCTSWNSFCVPQTASKKVLDCFDTEFYLDPDVIHFDAQTANGTFWSLVCNQIATAIETTTSKETSITKKYELAVYCQLQKSIGEKVCATVVGVEALFLCGVLVFDLGLSTGLILSATQFVIYGGLLIYFFIYYVCSNALQFTLAFILLVFSIICFLVFWKKMKGEKQDQESWSKCFKRNLSCSFPKKFSDALDKQKQLLNIVILTIVIWLVMSQLEFVNPKKDEQQFLEVKSMVWTYQWNSQCFETKQVDTFYFPIPERLFKNPLPYDPPTDCLNLQSKFNAIVYKDYYNAVQCENAYFIFYGSALIASQILLLMLIYTAPIRSFKAWYIVLLLEAICLILLLLAMSYQKFGCNHDPHFALPFGLLFGLFLNFVFLHIAVKKGIVEEEEEDEEEANGQNQSTNDEKVNKSKHQKESTSNIEIAMDEK